MIFSPNSRGGHIGALTATTGHQQYWELEVQPKQYVNVRQYADEFFVASSDEGVNEARVTRHSKKMEQRCEGYHP